MLRSALKVAATILVAIGLLVSVPAGEAPALGKQKARAVSKKESSKKTAGSSKTGRDSKRAGRSSKKRTDKRSKRSEAVAKKAKPKPPVQTAKRGKNEDSERRASSRTESELSTRASREPSRRTPDPSDEADVDGEEESEPPAPRPANRLVGEIAPGRVIEIQNALIKAGVLTGPPTGVYDQTTFAAMSAFQSRNGFDATGMPTAKALKALGVRKNSGLGTSAPSSALESTALDSPSQSTPSQSAPRQQPQPTVVLDPTAPRP